MVRDKPILFERYPNLKDRIPWVAIAKYPTPVQKMENLGKELEHNNLWIKRDDISTDFYGGNKIRKYEFVYGKILKSGKKIVATAGGIGTNHGLAAVFVGNQFGLKTQLYLFPQPLTWHVQRSLLLYHHLGAKIIFVKGVYRLILRLLGVRLFKRNYYLMLIGASPLLGIGTSLGTLGFVNAVFELKKQIDAGEIPVPDYIFVPCGSTGTAAGLIAGCKIVGLKTKIRPVRVADAIVINTKNIARTANKVIKLLRKYDKSVPNIIINENDFDLEIGYYGSNYGVKTKRGQAAVDKIYELEGKQKDFKIETTYTGKTLAAMIDFAKQPENKEKVLLFWNTYNSVSLDDHLKKTNFDYTQLPKKFHKFYETSFQCWRIKKCLEQKRKKCPAYLCDEYRCWKVKMCSEQERKNCIAYNQLKDIIKLEDA